MSEDMKEESSPTPPEVKEEDSLKVEEKATDESSKDSDKNDIEKNVKEEVKSGKESEEEEEEEEDDDEEEEDDDEAMGLLDRPVEVTGCRARKKVERLEVSFATPKDKEMEIPEGKGQKLGQCPRIEFQISKVKTVDLKQLHKILFNRVGPEKSVKKNIRKFSGFPFDKNSDDYGKKIHSLTRCNLNVLKYICGILDLDRGGTKENITERILEFLMSPKDSGKRLPSKKSKTSSGKKKQKKSKPKRSDENKSTNDVNDESDDSDDKLDSEEDRSDDEPKEKSKTASKSAASKDKTKKSTVKSKKEEKKSTAKSSKRKRDDDDDDEDESSDDDKPLAKKSKMPSDDEIKKMIKGILDNADLQEITMKKVIKQVSDAYPDFDLSHKKAFIKNTVKTLLNV